MNHDRITEVYEGTFGSTEQQKIARTRIHWIGRSVDGDKVLDVGCSQGIVSILLAREGREVVGIDNEEDAISFARRQLAAEEPAVRQRLTFELGDGTRLPSDAATFDTVVLGEILEHQLDYRPLLSEAARVLRTGGRVVITTPYGVFPYHDHKDPIYLAALLPELAERFEVHSIDLIGRYLGIVAARTPESAGVSADLWSMALDIGEKRLTAVEAELGDVRARAAVAKPPPAQREEQLAKLRSDIAGAQLRNAELEEQAALLARQLAEANARADAYEQQAQRLSQERAELVTELERLAAGQRA